MKVARKILTAVSLITMGLAVAILIGAIFGLEAFKGVWLRLLLTFATTSLACGFAINSLNLMKKQKAIPIISLFLIAASLCLALIIYWKGFNVSVLYSRITIMVAVTTIFFIIIISTSIKLDKKFKVLQFITYAIIIFIDVVITLQIWEISLFIIIPHFAEVFGASCLVAFGLLCALGILGKRTIENDQTQRTPKPAKGFVQIPLSEYENLKAEIEKLKAELGQRKE